MVTDALERKKRLGAERKYLEQYWEQDLEQNSEHDTEHSLDQEQ